MGILDMYSKKKKILFPMSKKKLLKWVHHGTENRKSHNLRDEKPKSKLPEYVLSRKDVFKTCMGR